jgi:hypothetical protein
MRQRLAELIDILYGFRKIIAFLLLFVISIVFRLTQNIDGGQFVDLMKNVSLAFFAANGIEHFTTMAKDFIASKAAPKPTDAPPQEIN